MGVSNPRIPHIKGHGTVIYHGFEMMRSFQTRLFSSQSAELGLPRGPDGTQVPKDPTVERGQGADGARDGCLGAGGDGILLALTGAAALRHFAEGRWAPNRACSYSFVELGNALRATESRHADAKPLGRRASVCSVRVRLGCVRHPVSHDRVDRPSVSFAPAP